MAVAIGASVLAAAALGALMGSLLALPGQQELRMWLGGIPITVVVFAGHATRGARRRLDRTIRLFVPAACALVAAFHLAAWNKDLLIGAVLGTLLAVLRIHLVDPLVDAVHRRS